MHACAAQQCWPVERKVFFLLMSHIEYRHNVASPLVCTISHMWWVSIIIIQKVIHWCGFTTRRTQISKLLLCYNINNSHITSYMFYYFIVRQQTIFYIKSSQDKWPICGPWLSSITHWPFVLAKPHFLTLVFDLSSTAIVKYMMYASFQFQSFTHTSGAQEKFVRVFPSQMLYWLVVGVPHPRVCVHARIRTYAR